MFGAIAFLALLSIAHGAAPQCSSATCPSECDCIQKKVGDTNFTNCAADSQCGGIMNCLFKCACSNLTCAADCVKGVDYDPISKSVATASIPCIVGSPLGTCSDTDVNRLWDEFLQKYEKTYSPKDVPRRRNNFKQSCHRALQRNKRAGEEVFGITKFSDLTAEEFQQMHLGATPPKEMIQAEVLPALDADVPTSFDWRAKGAVTPVKNQGQCGSCWAFSATETVESAYILKNSQTKVLSPQQITSCAGSVTPAQGCGGGWPAWAYQYVEHAGGQTTSADYPYVSGSTGQTGTCNKKDDQWVTDVKSFKYAIPPCNDTCTNQNEDALASALVNTAPISICVDATSWQDYSSGVLKTDCPSAYSDIDHCIQLVGYNKAGSEPYWIIRNSWGESWGNDGYIYVKMGDNLCGLADQATLVADTPPSGGTFVV